MASIPTSGPSPPTNDPGNSDGPQSIADLLSSGGSPPLIVAFLAIGLFIVAMIGVFTWRRMTRSRRLLLQSAQANPLPKPALPGERPTLWNLWADVDVRGKPLFEVMRWESMAPVAAILSFPTTPLSVGPPVTRCRPIGSMGPTGGVLFRTLGCLLAMVKRFYLPRSPPPPPPPEPPDEREKEAASWALDEMEWGDASSLQVSVVIAMPTRPQCSSRTSEKDVGAERTALGEFCIGTTDVPWGECG